MPAKYQKRHYQDVATVLRDTRPPEESWVAEMSQWNKISREFIKLFLQDNPQFDEGRFITWIKGAEAKR